MAAPIVRTSACCCAVELSPALAQLSLGDILLTALPEVLPNLSTARRAVRHQRVVCIGATEASRLGYCRVAATPPLLSALKAAATVQTARTAMQRIYALAL